MKRYQLYLLGPKGDIRNFQEFRMDSDDAARAFADGLQDAVSDICPRYELWRDNRVLFQRDDHDYPTPIFSHKLMTRDLQEELLRREEMLHESNLAIGRSRRLLERIRALRIVVYSRGNGIG